MTNIRYAVEDIGLRRTVGYGLEIPITTHAIHGFVKNMLMNDIPPSIVFETVTSYLNIDCQRHNGPEG